MRCRRSQCRSSSYRLVAVGTLLTDRRNHIQVRLLTLGALQHVRPLSSMIVGLLVVQEPYPRAFGGPTVARRPTYAVRAAAQRQPFGRNTLCMDAAHMQPVAAPWYALLKRR
jgi:hypothetical protein